MEGWRCLRSGELVVVVVVVVEEKIIVGGKERCSEMGVDRRQEGGKIRCLTRAENPAEEIERTQQRWQ